MREKGVEPDGLAYAGAIRAGVDGLLDAALSLKEDPTKVLAQRAALRLMDHEEAAEIIQNSPLVEEADVVYVARRCAAQGDVARTDAVAARWPSSPRCVAARVAARGNSGDVRGAVELAEARRAARSCRMPPCGPSRWWRRRRRVGTFCEDYRRRPSTAAPTSWPCARTSVTSTGASPCSGRASRRRANRWTRSSWPRRSRRSRRRGAATTPPSSRATRPGAGLVWTTAAPRRSCARSGGAATGRALDVFDLPVVGPLSAHAAVEACRAGADADRAVQIVEGLEAPSLALLADAAAFDRRA